MLCFYTTHISLSAQQDHLYSLLYHSLTLKIILSGADKEWDQELFWTLEVREGGDTFFHLFRGDGGVRVNCPSI